MPQGWKLEYTGWASGRRLGALGRDRDARRGARLRPHLGLRPRRDGAETRADSCASSRTRCCRRSPSARPGEARPARDVRGVPQCRAAREAGGVPRRHVGRQAHPRDSGRAGTNEEYASYGYRFPPASERLAILDETSPGDPPSLDRTDGHVRGRPRASRRRVLRPEADSAASGGMGRGRRRAQDATHRRRVTRTPPTGRSASRSFVRKSELLERHCEEAGRPFERGNTDPRARLPDIRHGRRSSRMVRRAGRRKPLGRHPDRRIP